MVKKSNNKLLTKEIIGALIGQGILQSRSNNFQFELWEDIVEEVLNKNELYTVETEIKARMV